MVKLLVSQGIKEEKNYIIIALFFERTARASKLRSHNKILRLGLLLVNYIKC